MDITNKLTISDWLDRDSEINICIFKEGCSEIYINREEAIKIVKHLTEVFELEKAGKEEEILWRVVYQNKQTKTIRRGKPITKNLAEIAVQRLCGKYPENLYWIEPYYELL